MMDEPVMMYFIDMALLEVKLCQSSQREGSRP
jgi:hypothetical protein